MHACRGQDKRGLTHSRFTLTFSLVGWTAHELVLRGLSWPTLDKPFWLDVGNTSFADAFQSSWHRVAGLSKNATLRICAQWSAVQTDAVLVLRQSGRT